VYGFRSSDVVALINKKGSPGFEKHLNNDCCWVCLSRVVLFVTVSEFLHRLSITSGIYGEAVHRYLKKINELSSSSDVRVSPIWLKARINYIGEETHIWLENGRICIEIVEPLGKKRKASLIPNSIRQTDAPSIAIGYPDLVTTTLLRTSS
jgi:hypothetical protein